ncbi:acyltransferase family protein [Fibrobacter sp.]|uniref:acyltransferase family protein n=1 Tax=Fibrobacter sp. TaxID=35828 RepID=UPI0038660559
MVIGFLLHDFNIYNIWCHQHALAMSIFLVAGLLAKDKIFSKEKRLGKLPISIFECCSIFLLILTFIVFNVFNIRIPVLNYGFKVSFADIPLYLYFSFLGTLAIITLSKLIKINNVLEYIGKNSIVVYLFHIFILRNLLSVFRIYDNDWMYCFGTAIVTFLLTVMSCLILAFLINTKHLKFIIGQI